MPNGNEHTPLTDDERADFFYSQLRAGDSRATRPDDRALGPILAGDDTRVPRVLLRSMGNTAPGLIEWGDRNLGASQSQGILRKRLIGRGRTEELADRVLADSSHSIVDLTTEREIWSSAWPTLEDRRASDDG